MNLLSDLNDREHKITSISYQHLNTVTYDLKDLSLSLLAPKLEANHVYQLLKYLIPET
jgi:hypothetical protein